MHSTLTVLAVAALAGVATATYECSSVALGDVITVTDPSMDWACAELTNIPHSANRSFTIRNEASAATGTQFQLIVHNPDASAAVAEWGFTAGVFKVVPPGKSWEDAQSVPNRHRAINSVGDTVFYSASGIFGTGAHDNACTGDYGVFFDLTGRTNSDQTIEKVHVLYRVAGRTNPNNPTSAFPQVPGIDAVYTLDESLSSGGSVEVPAMLLPGDTVHVPIAENFAIEKFMIANATMSVTGARTNLVANQSDWALAFGRGGFDAPVPADDLETTWSPSENMVTATYEHVEYDSTGSSQQGTVVMTVPELSDSIYDDHKFSWTPSTGAFIGFTVSGTFTEFPTLLLDGTTSIQQAGGLDDLATTTDPVTAQVYQVILPNLWWNMTVVPSSVRDENGDELLLSEASSELSLFWLAGDRHTDQVHDSTDYELFDDALSTYNPTFFNFDSADRRQSDAAWPGTLDPVYPKYLPRRFVRIILNDDQCLTKKLTFSITAKAQTIVGECSSYASCVVDKAGDHPAHDRRKDSANNEAKRFRQCGVFNGGGSGALVPSTKCFECLSDMQCREGQFCQVKDSGLCNNGDVGNYWCDSQSRSTYGLCVEKSKDVLGKECRTDSASAFTTGSTFVDTDVMSGDVKGFAPGYGFCGEATYYNSTGVDSSYLGGGFDNIQNGGVRKVLWEGFCFEGVCQECIDGLGVGITGRTCINGRILNRVTVDGTVRTFNQNTVAGATLTTALMVILLIFCFAGAMLSDANRNREFYGEANMSCFQTIWAVMCCCPFCRTSKPRGGEGGGNGAAIMPNP